MLKNDLVSAIDNLFPGVGKKGAQMQEDCIAFQNGFAYSYNGKVCVSVPLVMPVTGAVNAQMLRKLVDRMPGDELDITTKGNDLVVKCGRTKGGIKVDAEVRMPIDAVDIPKRDEFQPVAETFADDLQAVVAVSSKSCPTKPWYEGVHVMADFVEAGDGYQLMRIKGGLGSEAVLSPETRETGINLPADAVKKLSSYTVTSAIVKDDKWLHMIASGGVTVSVKLLAVAFPDATKVFNLDGTQFEPPTDFMDVVGRAKCLSGEGKLYADVTINGADGVLQMKVAATNGWVEEDASTSHRGEDIKFRINYDALEIASKRAAHVLDKTATVQFYADSYMHVIAKSK
jgi:hypothetical protein